MTLQRFAVRLAIPTLLVSVVWAAPPAPVADSSGAIRYKLLATNKTKTIRKEMNEAATHGYEFSATMTGPTLGGKEVVVVMSKPADASPARRYEYELLATNKTSTMQKELREAGAEGFRYRGQSVAKTSFGGKEVVVILEREIDPSRQDLRLQANGHDPNENDGEGTQSGGRGGLSPDGPHGFRDGFRRSRAGLDSDARRRRVAMSLGISRPTQRRGNKATISGTRSASSELPQLPACHCQGSGSGSCEAIGLPAGVESFAGRGGAVGMRWPAERASIRVSPTLWRACRGSFQPLGGALPGLFGWPLTPARGPTRTGAAD